MDIPSYLRGQKQLNRFFFFYLSMKASSLHLLDLNYGMRKRLVDSLSNVMLLEDARIAIYGEVETNGKLD